jgi:hypothetical protein
MLAATSLALTLVAALPPVAAAASPAAPAPASGCEGAPLCPAEERVAIVAGLREAIDARYVFRSVKPELLAAVGRAGFDPARHLEACVATERAIESEEDPLRFYDRMRRCTGAFDDGHLLLSIPGGLPQVTLGIGLRVARDGKVHVADREPALVRWLATDGGLPDVDAVLAVGVEVVAIDGEPVAEVLAALGAHLPASSSAARLERAADALTRRDFAYPRSPTARLTLAAGGARRTVELPWWIAPGAERNSLVAPYLRAVPLRTTDLVDWSGAPRWAATDRAAGPVRGLPVPSGADAALLAEYRGDAGHLAARLGEAVAGDGRRFCYAQLLTLHTETLAPRDGDRRPLVAVVDEFVKGCAARGRDLVVDLRHNGGGYISHSTAIARLIAPTGAAAARGALLLRANEHNEQVFRARAPALGGVRALLNGGARSDVEDILEAVRGARGRGEEFTPAFLEAPQEPPAAGFDGRVVALVAPTCMSACERLASMLQASGATLVGAPTEGAGGSQQEAKGHPARWVDPSNKLALSIPTAAMGVARARSTPGRTASVERFFAELALENHPVVPDVPYATGVEDLQRENEGWRAATEAALRRDAPDDGLAGGAAQRPRA